MQMSSQKNRKFKINIKKSHICLFGFLLIILGGILLSYNHILKLKREVFSNMQLSFIEDNDIEESIEYVPNVEEVKEETVPPNEVKVESPPVKEKKVDYSKYLGVLEIPRIGLKRGFYGTDSKYNNISYNVSVVGGSSMPDIPGGNLILIAHSGDAYISFFAYLYRLNIGNEAYVTYHNNVYRYRLVNIYNVPKNGTVKINRNPDKTTLTLITCTKDSDTEQTVYILEQE